MNVKLIISYDGTRYFGWQKTAAGPSIQGELEQALERLLQVPIPVEAASRTDRGVHARAQAVQCRLPRPFEPRRLLRALNAHLPADLTVQSVEEVPAPFHPTLDATGKEYHYFLCNGPVQLPPHRLYSWHIPQPLDLGRMQSAAAALIGTHDFSAFTNVQKNNPPTDCIRTLTQAEVTRLPAERLRIALAGDRFLYKMARNLAGALVAIGLGKEVSLSALLAGRDRTLSPLTAPAHGLFLAQVFYKTALSSKVSL